MFAMILLICAGALTHCQTIDVPRQFDSARACIAAIGGEVASRGPAARRAECSRVEGDSTENGDDQ